MPLPRSRFGSRWSARLLAIVLVAVPVLSLGLATPAAAWSSGPTCPSGIAAVTNISYVINGTATFSSLGGHVISGSTVTANFTIAPGCKNVQVSLASYRAPAPTYDRNTASQQVLFDSATGTFAAGFHTLQVFVPAGFFQVDFVLGAAITQLGPASSHNFYGDQGRLIDHDNGGKTGQSGQLPACDLTAIITGPPKQLQVTVQDSGFGLQTIVVTSLVNATVVVPPFTIGTAQSLVVVATKIDESQTAYLGLRVTNIAGGITDCDPPY